MISEIPMRFSLAIALSCTVFFSYAAGAAELTVLSGGAIRPGLTEAAKTYEAKSGNKVIITFNTTPQIRKRMAGGERFDVVIAPPDAIDTFARAGQVTADRVTVGRVGSGVAVRPGAPVPSIATADDLKREILAAQSVVFNRASSGQYIEGLLKKWGIWDQIEPKTTRYPRGEDVMEHLLKGKGHEIGLGPITEIVAYRHEGLVFVGPLPEGAQRLTAYVATPTTAGPNRALAKAFTDYLVSPEGKSLFVAAGVN
ncbi:MAG: substrate-binding domain-containing protein [Hyphomicrobiaceae bacterium]